jgi:hypothetical protein
MQYLAYDRRGGGSERGSARLAADESVGSSQRGGFFASGISGRSL